MRRAEVYSRHHPLEAAAAGQDSLSLQHSLTSSTNLDHQTNADGDTNTPSAATAPAVGFPHSEVVHFPIKKEFGIRSREHHGHSVSSSHGKGNHHHDNMMLGM